LSAATCMQSPFKASWLNASSSAARCNGGQRGRSCSPHACPTRLATRLHCSAAMPKFSAWLLDGPAFAVGQTMPWQGMPAQSCALTHNTQELCPGACWNVMPLLRFTLRALPCCVPGPLKRMSALPARGLLSYPAPAGPSGGCRKTLRHLDAPLLPQPCCHPMPGGRAASPCCVAPRPQAEPTTAERHAERLGAGVECYLACEERAVVPQRLEAALECLRGPRVHEAEVARREA
jgi:hypothetical protein